MYPMVNCQHKCVKKHFVLFLLCQTDELLNAQTAIGGSPHSDKRGRHEPKNKTSEAKTKAVKEHIESFPKYRSHYSRQDNPNRSYLSPALSVTKMYSLYKEKCT